MNIEQIRLESFRNWPSDAIVTPTRIAKAGFFYTKQGLTVECFSCHVQISEWNYGDQVMAKHKYLSPQCLFVIDPSTSGNVPNISQPSSLALTSTASSACSLRDEGARLQTFTNWPKPEIVTPEALARAGFYSLKENDYTKCAFCDVVLVAWEPGDDPDKEHKRCSPSCYFVQCVINSRLCDSGTNKGINFSNFDLVNGDNLEELGLQQHKMPKNPKYATYESRFATYSNWPLDLVQKPKDLTMAGFYYEGVGDKVRCFHCEGGLNHWDPVDDPWSQHARWFPNCAYVQSVKGKDFIIACAPSIEENDDTKHDVCTHRKEITESELQTHLMSEPAMAAFNVGLHVGRVKQAIREKLEQTGFGFSSSDALIEATLNIQVEEDDSNETDPQISRSVSNILTNVLHETLCTGDRGIQNTHVAVNHVDRALENETVTTSNLTLEEENRLLKEARLCKICMDTEVGIVFLPCGHLATCVQCAPNLKDCPVCRSAIKATVRTFLS